MADTITTTNPRTGEALATYPVADAGEVQAAVTRARKAFADWGHRTHDERRPYLAALQRVVVDNVDRIGAVIAAETGRDRGDALFSEVLPAAAGARYAAKQASRILALRKASAWPLLTRKGWVEYLPRGVAAIITPWNYPFYLSWNPTVTAVAAGCTVVLKPSEVTASAGQLVKDLADEAGLPSGVVEVVHGAGETGAALVADEVDIISFTGSPATGRKIAHAAAERLTPLILELGGNDAFVVLEDADVKRAARGALWGGMLNAGQTCVAAERVYVVDAVYEEFLAELTKGADQLNAGAGDRNDVGPITFPPQAAIIDRQLEDARSKGATILRGGTHTAVPDGGVLYQPTIVTDVDHTMELMQRETFGPVLAVMRVPDEQAALELANDSSYGLHGSVWTRNRERGTAFAQAMRTGTVAVNDVMVNAGFADLPFGGVGESGYGSNWGPEGLRAFSFPKTYTTPRVSPRSELWWFPRRIGARTWKGLIRLTLRR